MKEKINQTKIYKTRTNGWAARTYNSINGITIEIATDKRAGSLITTSMPVKFFFKNITTILSEKYERITKQVITHHHSKGLIIFDEMLEKGEIKGLTTAYLAQPKVGHILFMASNSQRKGSHGNKHILYKIEDTTYGINYHTVEADTLKLNIHHFPLNFKEEHGIGVYFEDDYIFKGSDDDLSNMLIDAHKLNAQEHDAEHAATLEAAKLRAELIKKGRQLVVIPDWAKSVIVADLYVDDSDIMTDYFSTSVVDTVILAFSPTVRNNINELKKAAQNFSETKDFTEKQTFGGYQLPSYFLGTSKWFGWKVYKNKSMLNHRMEDIYVLAGSGKYYVQDENPTPNKEEYNIKYIDYSDKSFAIVGDTKQVKDLLKDMGGKFNSRLTCGPGWIFSKQHSEQKVREYFNL